MGTVAFVLLIWGLNAVARRQFPLAYSELDARWDLWRGGVKAERIAGMRVYVKDFCGAEPCPCLLFIHGLGDTALTWKRVLLTPLVRWPRPTKIMALDLPGSGESPAPEDPAFYRVRRQAEQVNRILEQTPGCSSRAVIGNSLGGWVAAWAAIERPESIHALVLVDSAGLKKYRTEESRLLTQPTVESLKEFQRKAYFKPRPLPDFVWAAAVRRAASGNSKEIVKEQLPADDLDLSLEQIRARTLVFWGRADGLIPLAAGEEMAKRIPEARLHVQNECGHLPQKECLDALLTEISKTVF